MANTEEWITRRWQRPSDRRYYLALLRQDLWGDWVLTAIWGRMDTSLGRVKDTPCDSYDDGLAKLAAIAQRRRQHGYNDA